ncbi:GUN4 domain-containing protein [Stenomitos frigidus]|uniref:GUN4 domain-containing protein n=1 Tax=Stenomitos frigidus TaxID=1886765 RepID=UPI001C62513C|nr:GUN4 domain-containing protein [Stenomitos frigidus]
MPNDTVEIFISYSKQDKELRDGLLSHLRPLEREGIITWHDRQILPGTEWDDEIRARLNAADIILLLLSADFLATDYCTQVEIPEALRRHQTNDAIVMPVILRHCGWQYTPLAAIQAYPEKAKPIKSWSDIDEAYTNVVDGVYLAATEIKKRRNQQQQAEEQQGQRLLAQREAEEKTEWERLQREQQRMTEWLNREAEIVKQQKQELEQQRLLKQQRAQRKRQAAQTESTDKLASERGIDYTRLQDLLKAGQWKEADKETADRMCEVMGRQKERWLRVEDIQNFPSADLHTIDQLWVKHSQGRFGFSVQKKIWQACGSPTEYDRNWEKFGEAVEWKKKVLWIKYSEVTFDTSAPNGHLPYLGVGRVGEAGFIGMVWWVSLLSCRDL